MSAKTLPTAPTALFPLVLIAPFFLWGTAMVAMKGIMPHTTPLFVAGVRLVPAGVLVLGLTAVLQLEPPKTWRAWAWIGLFALLDGLMFQGFLAEGLLRTGAGLGSVMIDSQPIVIALLSSGLFGELIGVWGWLGLGIGVLGISLIGLPEDWLAGLLGAGTGAIALQWDALFDNGQWLMFLASLSMALGTVSIRYVSRHVDPVVATGWHMIIGGVPLFGMSALWETEQWTQMTGPDWGSLAYATVFGSAIAYALFFWIASSGNLTSFTSLTFLTPVFALVFGHLLLAEILNPVQWWGVVLTLVSIALINQRDGLTQWTRERLASVLSKQSSQDPAKVEGDSP